MKPLLAIFLLIATAGCTKQTSSSTSKVVKSASERKAPSVIVDSEKIDSAMEVLGNAHTPSEEELIANVWCAIDENLKRTSRTYDYLELSKAHNHFGISLLLNAAGFWVFNEGGWHLTAESLRFDVTHKSEVQSQNAEVIIASGRGKTLLKITLTGERIPLFKGRDVLAYTACK